MQIIRKGRLKTGDIFALSYPNDTYIFGRVIDSKLPMMGGHVALLYIYDVRSNELHIDSSLLTTDRLLFPPVIMFPTIWSRGYAAKVDYEEIQQKNLIKHRFHHHHDRYCDEYGNSIAKPEDAKMVGEYSILGLGIIDDKISDWLGIKRAPLLEEDIFYISGQGEKIFLTKDDSELRRYSNYEWVIKNYPEVIK